MQYLKHWLPLSVFSKSIWCFILSMYLLKEKKKKVSPPSCHLLKSQSKPRVNCFFISWNAELFLGWPVSDTDGRQVNMLAANGKSDVVLMLRLCQNKVVFASDTLFWFNS